MKIKRSCRHSQLFMTVNEHQTHFSAGGVKKSRNVHRILVIRKAFKYRKFRIPTHLITQFCPSLNSLNNKDHNV